MTDIKENVFGQILIHKELPAVRPLSSLGYNLTKNYE